MELKAILNKPYTENEKINFVANQINALGYEIKETESALEAWGKTESEVLESAKAYKYEQALLGAKEYIENEAVFQFDEHNSIEATDGNIGKLTAYALGFQTGSINEVNWTSKEDNVLTLSANDVLRILNGLGEIQSSVWNEKFIDYKNQIENAKTVEVVNAIKINYGAES